MAAVKEITTQDNILINQFIVSAVAEKIASFETQKYLEQRAEKGSVEKFKYVLSKVPGLESADFLLKQLAVYKIKECNKTS